MHAKARAVYSVGCLCPYIYVTRFAKICLIAGEHNCSHRPFFVSKVHFLLKNQKYDSSAIYPLSYNSGRALSFIRISRSDPAM